MALSRRNILVGLGALVGGGGALVGTGAFSTVSAQRSVSVNTTGDASGFVGLNATTQGQNYIDGVSNGTLNINLGGSNSSGFNQNAITTINSLFQITNNSAENEQISVGFSTKGPSAGQTGGNQAVQLAVTPSGGDSVNAIVTLAIDATLSSVLKNDGTGTLSSGYNSTVTIPSGGNKRVGVIVDTRDSSITDLTDDSDDDDDDDPPVQNSVTIVAEGTSQ